MIEPVTRRAVVGRAGAVAAALGIGRYVGTGRARAQDASPTPNPDGVAGEVLGADRPSSAPGMELAVRRTTIAPGGGIPPHRHPGAVMIVVDAGTWGYTPLGGTVRVTRAAGDGTPAAAEVPLMGVELILTKGDAVFIEGAQDAMRNAGEDEVVLLMAALTAEGQEFQTD